MVIMKVLMIFRASTWYSDSSVLDAFLNYSYNSVIVWSSFTTVNKIIIINVHEQKLGLRLKFAFCGDPCRREQ